MARDHGWAGFWEQQKLAVAPRGCLPQGDQTIDQAQRRAWHDVARHVPRKARVLDIATGDARVLRWLRERRPDLKLVGIDAAPVLPQAPAGCKIRGGIRMEQLPFGNATFDLVTSQFGFEYGDTGAAAREVGRALAIAGVFALMVHRGDGPILVHNRKRRAAIQWALQDQAVVQSATKALSLPGALPAVTARLGTIADEGARLHGHRSPAWEIAEATRRILIREAGQTARAAEQLQVLAAKAAGEAARIGALERACAVADARAALLAALGEAGLEELATKPVTDMRGAIIADMILLTKSG